MQLVANWRGAVKWFSVRAMALGIALQWAYMALPPDMLATLPPYVGQWITIAVLVCGIVGRLIAQPETHHE
jgi:hypothetical protein